MPLFSQKSLANLKTCHPELQVLFFEVIQYWDCIIIEGYRDKAGQERAFRNGNTKLLYPNSKHNTIPSMAVDVYPYPLPTNKQMGDYYFFGGFVLGIAAMLKANGTMRYSVRYGADWNNNQRVSDENFSDGVHFELKE